jgi:hypothetical protein
MTYDIVYSLGRDCACASYLKNFGLRVASGPFDWITLSQNEEHDLEKALSIVSNDFKDFFNAEDLKLLAPDPKIYQEPEHVGYENIRTGFRFYHDFDTGIPFDEMFPKVKEKYERRIQRFRDNIKNNKKVLLVWFTHLFESDDSQALALCNQVSEFYGKPIDFLLIEHSDTRTEKRVLSPHITKYYLFTRAKETDSPHVRLMGRTKECGRIFAKYSPLSFRLKKALLYIPKRIKRKISFLLHKS